MTHQEDLGPAEQTWASIKRLTGFWARFIGATVVFTLIFGPFAPLGMIALLLTLGLPVLGLTLWGLSLDEELGWSGEDRGPW